jgi:hypothetical protein
VRHCRPAALRETGNLRAAQKENLAAMRRDVVWGSAQFERDRTMSADGNWNLTISTPMGDRHATLVLKSDGGTLKGSQMAEGNSAEIFDGTVNGNDVAWKVSITNPMEMTLEFTGTVSGNDIGGRVKLGMFGDSSFSGTRG